MTIKDRQGYLQTIFKYFRLTALIKSYWIWTQIDLLLQNYSHFLNKSETRCLSLFGKYRLTTFWEPWASGKIELTVSSWSRFVLQLGFRSIQSLLDLEFNRQLAFRYLNEWAEWAMLKKREKLFWCAHCFSIIPKLNVAVLIKSKLNFENAGLVSFIWTAVEHVQID